MLVPFQFIVIIYSAFLLHGIGLPSGLHGLVSRNPDGTRILSRLVGGRPAGAKGLRYLHRQGVTAEGRSNLHPLNQGTDFHQRFLRDFQPLLPCPLAGISRAHALHNRRGNGDSRHFVIHELGIAETGEWPDSGDDRKMRGKASRPLQKSRQLLHLKDGVSHREISARLHLELEPANPSSRFSAKGLMLAPTR